MTVIIFSYMAACYTAVAGFYLWRFIRPARKRRIESLVLACGACGWLVFAGREFHFIPLWVASWLVWASVVGVTLHISLIYFYAQQPRG